MVPVLILKRIKEARVNRLAKDVIPVKIKTIA
jgi:hypothetical protein